MLYRCEQLGFILCDRSLACDPDPGHNVGPGRVGEQLRCRQVAKSAHAQAHTVEGGSAADMQLAAGCVSMSQLPGPIGEDIHGECAGAEAPGLRVMQRWRPPGYCRYPREICGTERTHLPRCRLRLWPGAACG